MFPCNLEDTIYVLKEETCLFGHSPNEFGNACIICTQNKCTYGFYIQEYIVKGFYINKQGLWLDVANLYTLEHEKFHEDKINSIIFFSKEEAEKYLKIQNQKIHDFKEKYNSNHAKCNLYEDA